MAAIHQTHSIKGALQRRSVSPLLLLIAFLHCCCYCSRWADAGVVGSGAATAAINPPVAQPKPEEVARDAKCSQPMEPGPCRMSLERYYYNAKTNTCETFKFGGCRGNDNKFGFRKTCEDNCLLINGIRGAVASSLGTTSERPQNILMLPTVRAVAATTNTPPRVLVTHE